MELFRMGLTSPFDTLFLTAPVLKDINWNQEQPGCGPAWQHAVEAALQGMSLDTRFAMLKQRFPQTLASAGVLTAGESASSACG